MTRLTGKLPILLTRSHFKRTIRYLRLFGPLATLSGLIQRLRSEGLHVFSRGSIRTPPIIDKTGTLQEETCPDEDTTVSVVIPVKNAGDDFRHLLSAIKNQKGFKDIEILVVDSGSTDRSLQISREFGAKIIQILPEAFSHSFARNLAAEQASGDHILFTVQDALPSSDIWLRKLVRVIKDNNVVAVSCTESLRGDVDLFYSVASWYHNRFMEVEAQDRIMCKPDDENHLTLRKNGQLSNVACLISKDVFMKYKFMGNYAEDLDLGIRLIKDGYRLALLSSTRIIHSHNRLAYYHLQRGYVDNIYMSHILQDQPVLAIEAGRLVRDLVFVYGLMNSIAYEKLRRLSAPCTIRSLSQIVMKTLNNARKVSYPTAVDITGNSLIDSKFRSFLQNLYNSYYSNDINSTYDGILLNVMQGVTMMILEYLDDKYKLMDDAMLEEFKLCLFKTYAFQVGRLLASCFLHGSESTKAKLKRINEKLTEGI